MNHISIMLVNTSSGIIEAASFKKHEINIGDRQKGRISGGNVIHVAFSSEAVIKPVEKNKAKSYKEKIFTIEEMQRIKLFK